MTTTDAPDHRKPSEHATAEVTIDGGFFIKAMI